MAEVDALRAHYRRHREALMGLVADAPTDVLAAQYRRAIADIDAAIRKLDEIEPPRQKTTPGNRPLVLTQQEIDDATVTDFPEESSDSRSRVAIIVAAAVIALVLIGWLIWRASDRPAATGTVADQPVATTTTIAEDAPAATAPAPRPTRVLRVTPDTADYGIVRKGTRATRQFEVSNDSEEPVTFQVSRSQCRCLFYEHAPVVPPKGKETLTVTIDGARAKAGPLLESVRVSAKSDPAVVTTFDVTATVR